MRNASNLSRELVRGLLEKIQERVDHGHALTQPELRTVLEIFKSQGQQERSLAQERDQLKGIPTDKLEQWLLRETNSNN